MRWLPELDEIEETPAMTGGRERRDAPDSEPSCSIASTRTKKKTTYSSSTSPWSKRCPKPTAACRTPVMDFGVLGNREEERGFETELGFGGGAHRFICFRGRRLESWRSRAPGRRHRAASTIGRLKKTLLPCGSHWSGSYQNGMACRAWCWAGLVGRLDPGKLSPFFSV
jgi:hypothetical protein